MYLPYKVLREFLYIESVIRSEGMTVWSCFLLLKFGKYKVPIVQQRPFYTFFSHGYSACRGDAVAIFVTKQIFEKGNPHRSG